jgi:tetratricopeptide (TPR) repeat protein
MNNIDEGERLFAEGKIDEAEQYFLTLADRGHNTKGAYNNLGVIAIQRNEKERAIEYFSKSLEIDPYYKDAILNYTDLLKTLNQLHSTIPLLEKVAETNPDDEEILLLLREAQDDTDNKAETNAYQTSLSSRNKANHQDVLSGKKILHAPFEIAGNMAMITKYLRLNNVNATCANYYDSWLEYKCDINLDVNTLPESKRINAIDNFAKSVIDKYDVFHFHFSHSLYPDFRDLEVLREKDKKILFSFWGSDECGAEWIYYQQARFLGYRPPKPYFLTLRHYHAHKIINLYADVMFGTRGIPRGISVPSAIDSFEWSLEEKDSILQKKHIKKDPQKTYFLHAPSSNWKKGTSIIVNLLEECKHDGMPIEIIYVHQVSPEKAKQAYAYADFAIDQVAVGTFGLFGLEMMCWNIPVLVYQTDLYDKIRNYPPVIKITKKTFKEQVAKCIDMKKRDEILEFSKKGRQWVMQNMDMSTGFPKYLKIYADLIDNKQIPHLINKAWFEQEHLLQSGFKSEFYRYMIEENVFNEIGVEIPEYDKRLYT